MISCFFGRYKPQDRLFYYVHTFADFIIFFLLTLVLRVLSQVGYVMSKSPMCTISSICSVHNQRCQPGRSSDHRTESVAKCVETSWTLVLSFNPCWLYVPSVNVVRPKTWSIFLISSCNSVEHSLVDSYAAVGFVSKVLQVFICFFQSMWLHQPDVVVELSLLSAGNDQGSAWTIFRVSSQALLKHQPTEEHVCLMLFSLGLTIKPN